MHRVNEKLEANDSIEAFHNQSDKYFVHFLAFDRINELALIVNASCKLVLNHL